MTVPVKYGDHEPVAPGAQCPLCGARPLRVAMDHCHVHGWTRGPACARCNQAMGTVDRGKVPSSEVLYWVPLAALIEQANRCPDCTPIHAANLLRPLQVTSVNARLADRDTLQLAALEFAERLQRRVSAADVLAAAMRVVVARPDEWLREMEQDPRAAWWAR